MMQTWGRLVARRAWTVLFVGLALVAATAVFGLGVFGALSGGEGVDPASESARSLAREQSTFARHDTDVVVIYSSPSMQVSDPAFKESVSQVVRGLPQGSVEHVITWYDTPSPKLVSTDKHATQVILTLKATSQEEKPALYSQVRNHLDAKGLTTNVGGPGRSTTTRTAS